MAVSVTTYLAASTAFATGVAATIAVSALFPGSPLVASREVVGSDAAQQTSLVECANGGARCARTGDEKVAQPNEKPRSRERAWSDPIKPIGSPASSSQEPPAELVFQPEAGYKPNVTERVKPARAQDTADHQSPAGEADATSTAKAGLSAESAQSTAAEIRTAQAKADPPSKENRLRDALRPKQTGIGQARSEQVLAAKANNEAERMLAVLGRSTVSRDRSREPSNHAQPRTLLADSLAAKLAQSRSLSFAGDRIARTNVMQPKALNYHEARRPDARFQADLPARRRSPEGEAREPKTRLSSADSGGIMHWLKEPGGSY